VHSGVLPCARRHKPEIWLLSVERQPPTDQPSRPATPNGSTAYVPQELSNNVTLINTAANTPAEVPSSLGGTVLSELGLSGGEMKSSHLPAYFPPTPD
jgi:hypothetical protein